MCVFYYVWFRIFLIFVSNCECFIALRISKCIIIISGTFPLFLKSFYKLLDIIFLTPLLLLVYISRVFWLINFPSYPISRVCMLFYTKYTTCLIHLKFRGWRIHWYTKTTLHGFLSQKWSNLPVYTYTSIQKDRFVLFLIIIMILIWKKPLSQRNNPVTTLILLILQRHDLRKSIRRRITQLGKKRLAVTLRRGGNSAFYFLLKLLHCTVCILNCVRFNPVIVRRYWVLF